MRSRLNRNATQKKISGFIEERCLQSQSSLSTLRPAWKIGDDVRQRIGDQLDEPNHRDPKIVLPHQVSDAPEYHKQCPEKPVERNRADERHETRQRPGV